MKKLILIAVMLVSTQAQAQNLTHSQKIEMSASWKATCYAYLSTKKNAQPEAFAKAKKLALADTYAGKYVANQYKVFTLPNAEVFKPMALHNCKKLNIQAK
jgi:hypothetical protein